MSSLADVHLSAGARYFIDNVCLVLYRQCLTLASSKQRVGPDLNQHSDVEIPTHTPDSLTNASYIREVDSRWPLLLPFPVVLPRCPSCRDKMDEGARITVPHESFHEVVLLFLQVLSLLRNASGVVVKVR